MDTTQESYISIDLPTGVSLGARIWRPVDAERNPVPAIVDYHPYRGCDYSAIGDSMRYSLLASKGYVCVKLDARGTGNSTGIHPDQFDEDYWTDAAAAIDWLAKQPWCNGKVGMVGVSWPAHASLMVATKRPPALGAIVPITAADDRYLNRYQGGCLLLYTVFWGSIFASMQARPPLPFVVGESWKEIWKERLDAFGNYFEKWASHPTFDAYWLPGSAADDLSRIDCPVLSVAGWSDPGYVMNVSRLLTGLNVPCRGIIGAWGHRWPNEAAPGPGIDIIGQLDRWFGHWLKGIDNDVLDDPALKIWILDGVPADPNRAERPGYWIKEDVWPSPNVSTRSLMLSPGRLAEEQGPATEVKIKSPLTVGSHAGEWMPWYPTGPGPHLSEDQRQDDAGSLVFDSAPLDDDMIILGRPTIELDVSSNLPGGQIVVRLCDIDPETNISSRITYGFLNLAHREGDVRILPVTPGEVMRIGLELFPIGYRIRKGHRLRIAISTCYWPIIWPAREDATLTIHLGAGGLNIPVRTAGGEGFDAGLGSPKNGSSVRFTQLRDPSMKRGRSFDVGTSQLVTVVDEDSGAFRLEDDQLEVGGRHTRRYSVTLNDPLSALCETEVQWTMRRGDWEISVFVQASVAADKDNFHITTEIEAFEGDQKFFAKSYPCSVQRKSV